MITIFKNIRETSTPFHRDIEFVFDRIKTGKNKDLVDSIRDKKNKSTRNDLKKNLPAVCFSGIFSKRADDAILEHSGFIGLDFDGYSSDEDLQKEREMLIKDKHVMSVFISPSGNGLKAIVKIPKDIDNHKKYFEALQEHFNSEHFDVTCKNISRVCYESYDPDIYINPDSKIWDKALDYDYKSIDKQKDAPTIPITDDAKIVDILTKWWTKNYPMIEGQRNNNLFIFASALNDYGINRSLADYILKQYESKDLTASEIKTTIDSAYRNTASHGTKYYEDEEALSRIRVKVNKGESVEAIKSNVLIKDVDESIIDSVIDSLEKDSSVKKFWTVSSKGTISIVHYLFKEFLQHRGFYKFTPHQSDKFFFVKVTNNLIEKAAEEEIKDFTLKYLEESIDDLRIYNFFADKTRYFKEDFLSLLDTVDVHFVEDTKQFSFIYFKNCALKVAIDDIEMVDYIDLDGYVWKDQVIDREFYFCDVVDCDFKKFISNISGNDPSRIKSLESTIGFLMSGYKDPGYCPSVILNDEVITENPEGGTGKGLLVQGIGQLKKVAMINGKKFSADDQFAYQTITTDTQVVSFDDVKKGFNFEALFSVITEGITIEKKNKDAIAIPFKFSPKIIITTNYAIRGKGNSFERRKWELELKQHYTMSYTPVDEFGRRFFEEWDNDEWARFDNYMILNLKGYLEHGLSRSKFKNVAIRRLVAETCHEFIEWMGVIEGSRPTDKLVYDQKIFKDDLYGEFILENPDFAPKAKMTISRSLFYKWLNAFGLFKEGIEIEEGRSKQGRWIMFKQISNETTKREKTEGIQEIPGLEY